MLAHNFATSVRKPDLATVEGARALCGEARPKGAAPKTPPKDHLAMRDDLSLRANVLTAHVSHKEKPYSRYRLKPFVEI